MGRFVYVVGGFERRSGRSTAAVERYDLRRDRWRRVRSMPVALNHPAAAAYRGDVYVVGGYTGRGDLRGEVSSLYRYDPGRDRWSRLPDAPTRRAALAVGVIGGRLYAAGGANSDEGALRRLEVYDFAARRWSQGPDMGFAREHLAGAVADGAFYVLAGRAAGRGNFKVAERYLPARAALGETARHAKAARRHRRGCGREPGRGGGRRGAVGHDPRGRGVRPATRGSWTRLPDLRTPAPRPRGRRLARGRVYTIEGGPTPGFDFSRSIEAIDLEEKWPSVGKPTAGFTAGRACVRASPLPHRLLLAEVQQAPPLRLRLPDVDAHVDDAAHLLQRADGGARIDVLASTCPVITSTTLNRRGFLGSDAAAVRGRGFGGRRPAPLPGAGFFSTFSSGTISAPVPFVPVSSTQGLRFATQPL